MENLHRENKEIDLITLPEELRRMKKLDAAGGLEYVSVSAQSGCDGSPILNIMPISSKTKP